MVPEPGSVQEVGVDPGKLGPVRADPRSGRYSEDDKGAVVRRLVFLGGDCEAINAECGVPLRTLRAWRYESPEAREAYLVRKDEEFVDKLEGVQRLLLEEFEKLAAEKVKQGRVAEVATAIGILEDKLRLREGRTQQAGGGAVRVVIQRERVEVPGNGGTPQAGEREAVAIEVGELVPEGMRPVAGADEPAVAGAGIGLRPLGDISSEEDVS